ncbi:hypothetical protein [Nocardia sp. BMG51109]|uniref:hypothetical protein n=1 Tax=Nocardia sp. BMG51109 TaxID=1056816 RepID=UPI0004653CC5|nr:hypothetical protein [Nocardia sp. BMG51109]
MDAQYSPRPREIDIHLSVHLANVQLDFAACVTAARGFVDDWETYRYFEAVDVIDTNTAGLPRLPNERLFLDR